MLKGMENKKENWDDSIGLSELGFPEFNNFSGGPVMRIVGLFLGPAFVAITLVDLTLAVIKRTGYCSWALDFGFRAMEAEMYRFRVGVCRA